MNRHILYLCLTYVLHILMIHDLTSVDPQISYSGLLAGCSEYLLPRAHLESAKAGPHLCFRAKYNKPLPPPMVNFCNWQLSPESSFYGSPPKPTQAFTDKIQEYFRVPHENFDTCDPSQWWAGRRSQFPNLSRFARDLLAIPAELSMKSFDALSLYHFFSLDYVRPSGL